jgi:hypothetical protein
MGRIKAHHPRRLRPADGATAGTPVVDEDYYRYHPRPEGGWPLDQWRVAAGRDADPDLAPYVATELEEHLGLVVREDYEPVVKPIYGKPVTMHYYLRTGWDGERGIDFFQAVLYIAEGWVAVNRPWVELAEEDDPDAPDGLPVTYAWQAHDLAVLLADRNGERVFPELTTGLSVIEQDLAHLSDYLRDALAVVSGRS